MAGRGHVIDLTGQRFGILVVTERWPINQNGEAVWETVCDCGNTALVRGSHLRGGTQKRCGLHPNRYVHGHAPAGRPSKEYRCWQKMIERCENSQHRYYKNYGGRGISVCRQWRESFQAFLDDVGFRPSLAFTLDRINNDGNYEPGNVRWATRAEQARNRRVAKRRA